jgi:Concanavalin A-like lectin/glucanases superfamily
MNKVKFVGVVGIAVLLVACAAIGQDANDSRFQWYYGYSGTPDANTVALWHFDEGSGVDVYDATSNANDGVCSGNVLPQWAEGKFGGALFWQGDAVSAVKVHVDTETANTLILDGDYTLEAWVKLGSKVNLGSVWPMIVTRWPNYRLAVLDYRARVDWAAADDWGAVSYPAYTEPSGAGEGYIHSGEWTHVAATWNNTTKEVKLYIMGNLVGQKSFPGFQSSLIGDEAEFLRGLVIGDWQCDDPDPVVPRQTWTGSIDEVRISNVVREFVPKDSIAIGGQAGIDSIERGLLLTWDADDSSSLYVVGWKTDLTESEWTVADLYEDTGSVLWLDSGDEPDGGRTTPLDPAVKKRFYNIGEYK